MYKLCIIGAIVAMASFIYCSDDVQFSDRALHPLTRDIIIDMLKKCGIQFFNNLYLQAQEKQKNTAIQRSNGIPDKVPSWGLKALFIKSEKERHIVTKKVYDAVDVVRASNGYQQQGQLTFGCLHGRIMYECKHDESIECSINITDYMHTWIQDYAAKNF